jgi:hypothetical protein
MVNRELQHGRLLTVAEWGVELVGGAGQMNVAVGNV